MFKIMVPLSALLVLTACGGSSKPTAVEKPFVVADPCGNGFFVSSGDGVPRHVAADGPVNSILPAVSPDGQRIAYVRRTGQGQGGVHIVKIDGTDDQLIAPDLPASNDNGVDVWWSPDGQTIAFERADRDQNGDEVPSGTHEVVIVPASGGDVRMITDGEFVAWSQDGRSIAYANSRTAPGVTLSMTLISTAATDGSGGGQLAEGEIGNGDFSLAPDFKHIAWLKGGTAIFVSPTGDTLTPREVMTSTGILSAPVYSPDGSKIAFTGGGVWVTDADGSDRRKISDVENTNESPPVWTADGTEVVFGTQDGGGGYFARADGSGTRPYSSPFEGLFTCFPTEPPIPPIPDLVPTATPTR